MSMNINMNKKVVSALMCALLCTGDISAAALNQSAQVSHTNAAASYQIMQNVLSADDGYDDFGDDDNEDTVK